MLAKYFNEEKNVNAVYNLQILDKIYKINEIKSYFVSEDCCLVTLEYEYFNNA